MAIDEQKIYEFMGRIDERTGTILKRLDEGQETFDDHEKRIASLENVSGNCSIGEVKKDVETLKRETDIPRFYARYPRLGKLTVIAIIIALLISIGMATLNARFLMKMGAGDKTELTEKK